VNWGVFASIVLIGFVFFGLSYWVGFVGVDEVNLTLLFCNHSELGCEDFVFENGSYPSEVFDEGCSKDWKVEVVG